MSSAIDFLERLETDDTFRSSVDAVGSQAEKMEVIRAAGFDLHPSDVADALETRYGLVLTDDQIEQLSGGSAGEVIFGYSNNPNDPNYSEHGGWYDLAVDTGATIIGSAAAGAF